MSVSCIEQIALAIEAALNTLVAAGHVASVERPKRIGLEITPRDKTIYLYQDSPTEDAEASCGFKQWLQPFVIDCFVVPSDESTTPVDTAINELRARVEMKVREDPIFGLPGLVIETEIQEPVMFSAVSGAYAGIRLTAVVVYRTRENDPYSYT
jgi:hypothetical protein